MKKFVAAAAMQALLVFFAAGAFCEKWTEYEESLVGQVMQARLESRMKKSDQEAGEWLLKKREEFFSSIDKEKVCEEAKLAYETMFALEQYHFMWEIDSKAKSTVDFAAVQFNKVMDWNAAHPIASRNEWYAVSAYEMINAYMPNLKYKQKISLGLEEKKVYDSMVAAKCQKGILYINAGLWYAFAPAIGGGSVKKAKDLLSVAAKIGPSGYEKFLGFVYLSQCDFILGDKASCEKHLREAENILPGNAYTSFVRRLNEAGIDAFKYADDKDAAVAKMDKFYGKKNGKK